MISFFLFLIVSNSFSMLQIEYSFEFEKNICSGWAKAV